MKNKLYYLSSFSSKTLLIGLPIVLICFIYLVISFLVADNVSQNVLLHIYTPQLESFMMSLTILILGTILLDISEKELEEENK